MGLLCVPLSRVKDIILKGNASTEAAYFYAQFFSNNIKLKYGIASRSLV
jgi:hypothetical protein